MNRTALPFVAVVLQVILAAALAAPSSSCAEVLESAGRSRSLIGTWELLVSPVDCETGAPAAPLFSSVQAYLASGVMTEIASSLGPPFVSQRTAGLGAWRREGVREYRAAFKIYRFDANGAPLDQVDVDLSIELARNRDELVGAGRIRSFAPNGTELGTVCSTSTGRRVSPRDL